MKEFSHPGGVGRTIVDINHALQSTVIPRNLGKRGVQEIDITDLGETL